MPKLFPPPRRARKRSELVVAFAETTSPVDRTISKLITLSQVKPSREEKNERPPRKASSVSETIVLNSEYGVGGGMYLTKPNPQSHAAQINS